ncbi:sugar phosphate isomerase/epimerase [Kamptonema cortianum]|uniref:Sugar phosphate isomerase/epimerase n=1 Tax=Geitlerinema calcuttense NRMC-F 0142 TaxID=2922238 RepID=A0ABT7LY09_9CYAN|nr:MULTISPECIES: sugar phosphate isomerase/epimerase [Cyanophyceae]MDK3157486.1 sugar phosphate isomerase/epimerase [Kamptonema cortianum]MDL5052601.1 sugar phosphate isomerase/epimerase [Oscillatoria laete-virens NRMC-F 0139]MDL5056904.1 sugar phosphate isomerase/epimerase [Geitlerinema calcuttense NRMC-F 0142]
MAIKVGCFALINPFRILDAQLQQIQDWGFKYGDVTDNTDGACLGAEFGFTAVASLDANPFDLKRMFESHGITITSYCCHANLLDPAAPWRYGTAQIIKGVRSAAAIGVKHVITTEGEPHTSFGQKLSEKEMVFSVREKLAEPLRVAADHGVKILFEPHGPVSCRMNLTEAVLHECDSSALGINLDTGNLWLGGGEPVEYVKKFGKKIEHVHWKDMPKDLEHQRGKVFGCGMALIPLGAGVVGIKSVYEELVKAGFHGFTTLEVAGEDAVKGSYKFLKDLGAE